MPSDPPSARATPPPDAPPPIPLDAHGRERPAFLLGFPEDPGLQALTRAFEAGNYAYVRREAPALAEHARDPDVQAAARELLRRLEPEPAAKYLLAASGVLLVVLTLWAYLHHAH